MSKTYFSIVLLAVALIVVGLAGNARAELLFSDSFDGAATPSSTNGWSLNDNLTGPTGRLGGTVAATIGPVAWKLDRFSAAIAATSELIAVNDQTNGKNMMTVYSPSTSTHSDRAAIIQKNFNHANLPQTDGGFVIRFDTDPISSQTGTPKDRARGSFVFLGAYDGTESTSGNYVGMYDDDIDFSLYLKDNGTYTVFNHYSAYQPFGTYDSTPNPDATPQDWAKMYTVEIHVATTQVAAGVAASITAFVGPKGGALSQIDLNNTTANPANPGMSFDFNWDDGNNYMGFGHYATTNKGNISQIDNVSISSIPEPSTLALLGMGLMGLLAYAWRKRR